MFSQLKKKGNFGESEARFYGAEVIVGLRYIHSKGILYRDLKPENILLDEKGHIKISDFGICNKVDVNFGKVKTVIGTAQYMAPEVFDKSRGGYSFSFDVWSLGCFLYELVVGEPPFGKHGMS